MKVSIVALALAAVGCADDPPPYTYVEVDVTLDQATISIDDRMRIDLCQVTPSRGGSFNLPCPRGKVPYALGKFEFATTATKGDLFFTLAVKSLRNLIGEGTSDTVTIVPGKSLPAKLLVKGFPTDAGADVTGGGPDTSAN